MTFYPSIIGKSGYIGNKKFPEFLKFKTKYNI
jgi:hypothetical protein